MLKSRVLALTNLLVLAAFTLAAQERPNAFAELAARAAAARDAHNPAEVIALYKQALDLNPKWAEGWWMTGSLQYDSGSYADAAVSLGRLVKLSPQAGPAWALLGLCQYETGDFGEALEEIQRSLSLGVGNQPQMVLVLKFHEAALLTKAGRFDEAMRKYSGFLPSEVTDEQVLTGLGLTQLRVAAIPSEVVPERREIFRATGRALAALLTGDAAGARAGYEQLIRRFPSEANAHYAYGYFLFGSDASGAIREWNQAVKIEGTYAGAHAMLAWAYWLQDDSAQALEHARKALDKDASLTVARIVLGRLTAAAGRTAEGIGYLERAIHDDPANLEAHLALATAYSGAGRKLDAQRERQLCLGMQAEAGTSARP